MPLDSQQVARFKVLWDERLKDTEWVEEEKELDAHRVKICAEFRAYLDQFLNSKVTVEDFKNTFDAKTRKGCAWDGFGLSSTNYGMFFNMLVKYTKDPVLLTGNLRKVLPTAAALDAASNKMAAFNAYLEEQIAAKKVKRREVQPARAPHFISACWHLQDTEMWPIFYPSAQRIFQREGIWKRTWDSVEKDYFSFREVFRELANALNLKTWDLEHLLYREDYLAAKKVSAIATAAKVASASPSAETAAAEDDVQTDDVEEETDEDTDEGETTADVDYTHQDIQLLLAQIGQKMKYKIWIASNDHCKKASGIELKSVSIDSLPNLVVDDGSQKIISLIDVLWLTGKNQIVAAFEIETSTSIYSGLLRMSDLAAEAINLKFPFFIVAPTERIKKVQKQLKRPTFRQLGLDETCGYFSCETLMAEAKPIMQYATDVAAIEKLASYVALED